MPLSGASRSAASPQNRTDTMIGAGMRVDGHVAFTGVLRIQGDVLGDVACPGDAGGTVAVDATGSVTGAIGAPRIVVRGRVLGPLHSAQSIDIQQGGSVVGDAFYKQIVIHAGGVIEGVLTPALPVDAMREAHVWQAPDAGGASRVRRFGGRGALGGAAVLAIAAAAGVWMSRPSATPEPPAVGATAQDVAASSSTPRAAAPAASPEPAANADVRAAAQPESPARPAEGAEDVITVQGVNSAKPAGVFLLISREPSILYRKKRGDEGEGTRFAVQQGKTVSVAVGRNELFRVAEGRKLEIFYQGRKVSPQTIESGAWMSFVPQEVRVSGEDQAGSEGGPAR